MSWKAKKLYGQTTFIVQEPDPGAIVGYDRELFEVLPDASAEEVLVATAAPLVLAAAREALALLEEKLEEHRANWQDELEYGVGECPDCFVFDGVDFIQDEGQLCLAHEGVRTLETGIAKLREAIQAATPKEV